MSSHQQEDQQQVNLHHIHHNHCVYKANIVFPKVVNALGGTGVDDLNLIFTPVYTIMIFIVFE